MGALPSMTRLVLTDPKLAYHFYCGTAYPPCYRLVGPGAHPGARDAFLGSPEHEYHATTLTNVRRDALDRMQPKPKTWFLNVYFIIAVFSFVLYLFVF